MKVGLLVEGNARRLSVHRDVCHVYNSAWWSRLPLFGWMQEGSWRRRITGPSALDH